MIEEIISNPWFTYAVLPLLIVMSRIIDVSMGTIRVILISKGYKTYAPIIGFFEVIIWLLAIRQIMDNLTNWVAYFAYGLGFALGTYIGMVLEEKLITSKVLIRVVEPKGTRNLAKIFKEKYNHVTSVKGEGTNGEVIILFIILDRKKVQETVQIIRENNPKAYYTIENIKDSKDNDFLGPKPKRQIFPRFTFYRKGK
ncbi:DUF5698 domain-containing protein [Candidatus Woesearchaeota archaeon]|nr:DUF5698 domain-containing protein [Candidatus Woesearchaeota archaeon]MCF7900753.1 DUF5698 domain-containing protein [Candidatus Woesearchaeota archaeon]MCF8012918.1 DUF5698 domain-containing protein [Candidatus Woesearchaeota archaeon]